MWASKIQNIQVRRLDGNDLDYLNLNLSLHLAKYFQILLEGVFEFTLIRDDGDEEAPEDFEDCEININYLGNNIQKPFDVNHFMHWMQMTLYIELIRERNDIQHDIQHDLQLDNQSNDNGQNEIQEEQLNYLNEVLDMFNDFKDAESYDNLMDSFAMNLFYD